MISTKDKIKDWTSMKCHSTYNWKPDIGKFLKRFTNRKIKYKKIDIDKYKK